MRARSKINSCRRGDARHLPEHGDQGLCPRLPRTTWGFCDGPSTESLVGPELLGAWANDFSGVPFAVEDVGPRVLTLTMVPQFQASMSLAHPPTRCVATEHMCAAPLTSSEGPQAQRIPFLKSLHGPSLLLVLPPPRRALRLPSAPRRLTPHQRVPAGTVRQGGVQGKSRIIP
jgi:hypothetical protein